MYYTLYLGSLFAIKFAANQIGQWALPERRVGVAGSAQATDEIEEAAWHQSTPSFSVKGAVSPPARPPKNPQTE